MAIDFPSTGLVDGYVYTSGNLSWQWDEASTSWMSIGSPVVGYTGSIGVGYTGSQGDVGYTGSQGDQGIDGSILLSAPYFDISVNEYTAVLNGNVNTITDSPYVTGAGSFSFGSSDYLTVTGPATGSGTWTVECWVFFNTLSNNTPLLAQGNADTTGCWLLWCDGDGTIRFYSNGNIAISSAGALTTGQWIHVAVVSNSSNVNIYVDGTSVASGSYAGKTFDTAPFQVNHGYGGVTTGNSCKIADIRLVNTVAVYTTNFTPPTEPLTAITNTNLLLPGNPLFVGIDYLTDVDTSTTAPTSGQALVYDGSIWAPSYPLYPLNSANSVTNIGVGKIMSYSLESVFFIGPDSGMYFEIPTYNSTNPIIVDLSCLFYLQESTTVNGIARNNVPSRTEKFHSMEFKLGTPNSSNGWDLLWHSNWRGTTYLMDAWWYYSNVDTYANLDSSMAANSSANTGYGHWVFGYNYVNSKYYIGVYNKGNNQTITTIMKDMHIYYQN